MEKVTEAHECWKGTKTTDSYNFHLLSSLRLSCYEFCTNIIFLLLRALYTIIFFMSLALEFFKKHFHPLVNKFLARVLYELVAESNVCVCSKIVHHRDEERVLIWETIKREQNIPRISNIFGDVYRTLLR